MPYKQVFTRFSTVMLLSALSGAVFGDALDGADPQHGQKLHASACVACHQRLSGGGPGALYTRPERLVTNRAKLLQRVAVCVASNRLNWRPQDEADVARYLNDAYYHFPR